MDFTGMESRSKHPSTAQLESLIQFLEDNPDLAKGFSKYPNARARSNAKWEALSVKLNSVGGTIKSSKQWIKYWSDKKNAVKKKVAIRNNTQEKTGGGVENVPELSDIEERIFTLMAGERGEWGVRAAARTPCRILRRALQASPPSQRRSQFISLTEKFLRLEEQRLELDQRVIQVLEQAAERERLTAQANLALGEGLKALADAINSQRNP